MVNSWADLDLMNASFGAPVKRPKRAKQLNKLLVVGAIVVLLVLGLITKAFAHQGLIYESSGTCSFSKEPEPCEHYVSPCVKGAEYFYFPSRGVLRTRDNRIVEVET